MREFDINFKLAVISSIELLEKAVVKIYPNPNDIALLALKSATKDLRLMMSFTAPPEPPIK